MKKRIIPYIVLACLAALSPASSSAASYAAMTTSVMEMQSVAPMHTITSTHGKVSLPYSSQPIYVEALSGNMSPFGASSSSSSGPRRERPGQTGGDTGNNPDIETPISDANWFLLALACAFVLYKLVRTKFPRTRKEERQDLQCPRRRGKIC